MLKSSLCDYSDAYILVRRAITATVAPTPAAKPDKNSKKVEVKNCAPFTDCISNVYFNRI